MPILIIYFSLTNLILLINFQSFYIKKQQLSIHISTILVNMLFYACFCCFKQNQVSPLIQSSRIISNIKDSLFQTSPHRRILIQLIRMWNPTSDHSRVVYLFFFCFGYFDIFILLFTHHYSAMCFGINVAKFRDAQAKIHSITAGNLEWILATVLRTEWTVTFLFCFYD